MRRLDDMSALIARYREMGGVLEFFFFEEAGSDEDTVLAAMAAAIPGLDTARLHSLGCRLLDEARFMGDWFDPATGDLIQRGDFTTAEGDRLENPRLASLSGVSLSHGGYSGPEGDGQFAYAFSQPPYPLHAPPEAVQDLFDSLRMVLLPPWQPATILDWSHPSLPEVSAYFEDGAEWWGMFLFTIHLPVTGRLVVIAGSATD